MAEKTQILFQCSVTFKDALGVYAQEHNVSSAEVIREAVSALIGYDINADKAVLGPPRKYATKEDRLAAASERQRDQRALGRRILEAVEKEMKLKDIKAIEDWVNMRGRQ